MKNADFQASTASRKLYFPISWACQRAFRGGLPARATWVVCPLAPSHPIKARFTKGLGFSLFMHHGWNPEWRRRFASKRLPTASSPCIYNFVFAIFIEVFQWKITPAQHIRRLRAESPAQGWVECLHVCLTVTVPKKLKEQFHTCEGSLLRWSHCRREAGGVPLSSP